MNYQDFASKLRQWEIKSNQWFLRHSFVLFLPIILACFVALFVIAINLINISPDINRGTTIERLLLSQNISTLFIIFLILLNSFWMLFMLASLFRIRAVLKNVDFNLSRRRNDRNSEDSF